MTRRSDLYGFLTLSIVAVLLVFGLDWTGIIPPSEQDAILRTATIVSAMACGYLIVSFTTLRRRRILAFLAGFAVLLVGQALRVVLA